LFALAQRPNGLILIEGGDLMTTGSSEYTTAFSVRGHVWAGASS